MYNASIQKKRRRGVIHMKDEEIKKEIIELLKIKILRLEISQLLGIIAFIECNYED